MKFARLLLLVIAASGAAQAQWDNSGNSMLNGEYYFRQVIYVNYDEYGDLSEAVAVYGNIKFDGNGNYSIAAAEKANYADTSCQCVGQLLTTGTYSIAASGFGFISSPYVANDLVFGMVSAQGIFIASSTENANGYNDMLVAAPVASPLPTASSFTGSWVCADFDYSTGSATSALSLLFTLNPDGVNNLGNITMTGYVGQGGSSQISQTYTGLKYSFSNGAAVAAFPNSQTSYMVGQKYFYFSKDGNFLFGGSPNSFDFIVGVKTTSGTPTMTGLYYQAGMDANVTNYYPQDSYYGAFTVIAGAAPQSYLAHERVNTAGGVGLADDTYTGNISLTGSTYAIPGFARYAIGSGGAVEIGSGIGPSLGISVAVQAPNPTPTGVFINPTAVQNSASSAPFTASIAPGELITLYGSNLAAATAVAGNPFPMSLGNVQVSIGGLPAAIYYVSATQVSAIVPYGITANSTCGCVQIQLTNNGTLSNVVTEYVGLSAPGVFTKPAGGLGYGAIEDAITGALITPSNPAVAGENLAVYLTGLGAVSPGVADGSPGSPYPNLSTATNTFAIDFNGVAAATPTFAGLQQDFPGLYQLNVVVPTGLTAGMNSLGIQGPDTYMSYLLVPIGSGSTSSAENANVRTAAEPASVPARLQRPTTLVKSPHRGK